MRLVYAFLLLALCFCQICELSASSGTSWFNTSPGGRPDRNRKIGDFKMIGRSRKHSVDLSNNILYQPTNKGGRKKTKKWQLRDTVRLLRTETHGVYILINLRTGDTVKCTILNLH
jgi:hypothetical protein